MLLFVVISSPFPYEAAMNPCGCIMITLRMYKHPKFNVEVQIYACGVSMCVGDA